MQRRRSKPSTAQGVGSICRRTRGPSCLPICSSEVGSPPPRPKRSEITSRWRSGSFETARRTASPRIVWSTSSSVVGPDAANRSPRLESPSEPIGASVEATVRAAERTSFT